MTGYIVQISETPISEDEYASINRYETESRNEIFVVADHINEASSEEADEGYSNHGFFSIMEGIKYNANEKSIVVVDKNAFFRERYEAFIELVNRLSDASIEDFAGLKLRHDLFELQHTYESYLTYVDNGWEPKTLDRLIRDSAEGTKYYFGAVFRFHI